MSTDFSDFNYYLLELAQDVYPQPADAGHLAATEALLLDWLPRLTLAEHRVLDLGCGQGIAAEFFEEAGYKWKGVTLGKDVDACHRMGLDCDRYDFSFLPYADKTYPLLYARHALEHSPMPLLTLMEWHRVCADGGLLILVVPLPKFSEEGPGEVLGGRNHYYLLTEAQWTPILDRAGWNVIWSQTAGNELRMLCGKQRRERPR